MLDCNANTDKYIEDKLISVTSSRPGLVYAWVLLTQCYLQLQYYIEGIEVAKKTNHLLSSLPSKDATIIQSFESSYIELLSKSSNEEDWKTGLELVKEVSIVK